MTAIHPTLVKYVDAATLEEAKTRALGGHFIQSPSDAKRQAFAVEVEITFHSARSIRVVR